MRAVDLSTVFKTRDEVDLRYLANLEFFQTLPNIGYLFLMYYFLADLTYYHRNADGFTELKASDHIITVRDFIVSLIDWFNNAVVQIYVWTWAVYDASFLPLIWFNTAV